MMMTVMVCGGSGLIIMMRGGGGGDQFGSLSALNRHVLVVYTRARIERRKRVEEINDA